MEKVTSQLPWPIFRFCVLDCLEAPESAERLRIGRILIWVLEAARDKTKETIVGIKVAYHIFKHSRSVDDSK